MRIATRESAALRVANTFLAIQDLVVEHKLFPEALSMILEHLYRVPFQG